MKKNLLIKTVLITAIICSIFCMTGAFAESPITVTVDGQPVEFDVQPQLINDRTMVPLRAIFEELGAAVSWDEPTQTVTAVKEGYTVTASIGSTVMTVNGTENIMDTAPMLIDSRTLVPARFVAEAFDCKVDWDDSTCTVIIYSGAGGSYYEESSLPNYTSVTGISLKETLSDDTGRIYKYELTKNSDEVYDVLEYIDYLCSNGWTLINKANSEELGGTLYALTADKEAAVIGILEADNEVWIAPYN